MTSTFRKIYSVCTVQSPVSAVSFHPVSFVSACGAAMINSAVRMNCSQQLLGWIFATLLKADWHQTDTNAGLARDDYQRFGDVNVDID